MNDSLPPSSSESRKRVSHSAHFGSFAAIVDNGRIVDVEPFEKDPFPTDLIKAIPDAVHARSRIAQPMVRAGYLEQGPGGRREKRGIEPFVPVSWDEALDLVAAELRRVKRDHGNDSIFAGSYGWASAGRLHHAKTQLKRFMAMFGGYTDQTGTYSNAAGHVILPHVTGSKTLARGPVTSWDSIASNTELFVTFGGLGLKNTQVEPGGMGEHAAHKWLHKLKDAPVEFVSITPIKDDTVSYLNAEWVAIRPNADVAMMLAIAQVLIAEGLHDQAYLDRYCVGFDTFRDYVMGVTDQVVKSPEWAAPLCEVDAQAIRELARRMASGRTMIGVAYSLQRAEHGEQTYWGAITLAAMLGQIGLPGGGFGCGYGSMHGYGNPVERVALPSVAVPKNPIDSVIPVARIADMLLNPGGAYRFNGADKTYPDTRLVYWVGGNPFHHHQDLNRLVRAWRQPETVIVNEIWWTPTAKFADIVLPATTTLERNDIGASGRDRFIMAMQQAVDPVGEARSDFAIFSGLCARLGFEEKFTEGRDEMQWLRHMYDVARQQIARKSVELPDFDTFWQRGYVELPEPTQPFVLFDKFRNDPDKHPLGTPSGKFEIFSSTIDSFGYEDCPGHPTWMEPQEWLGSDRSSSYPLHMISNQPQKRLHGQMDDARVSQSGKVAGREPAILNPADASARGIAAGDIVRVFNDRGELLAGAQISESIRPGVVQLATGAWFDPLDASQENSLEKHGNPNVLTQDRGTSSLAQGPSAHSALVEIERFDGEAPAVTAHEPPAIVARDPA